MTTEDKIREALATEPSPDARVRHLEQIRETLDVRLRERLHAMEQWKAGVDVVQFQLREQIEILTGQVRELREAQKQDETDRYVELRRGLLVIGLTEILFEEFGVTAFQRVLQSEEIWPESCAELHRRYGHLVIDHKPLWANPPKPPRPETKALIAESLRRRQEA